MTSGRRCRNGVRVRGPNESDEGRPDAPWIRPDDDRSLPCPLPRSPDEARARTRRFGGDPADGPARSPRRDFDRRRRRDLKTSRQGRDGREQPAGARLRSRLSRSLGAGGDRHPPALAGARGAGLEICRASSVGPGPPGHRSRATACRTVSPRCCAPRGCCARTARTRPRRCAGACPAGRPCIIGKAWPVPSDRRRCGPRSGWRCAPRPGRGPGRAKRR